MINTNYYGIGDNSFLSSYFGNSSSNSSQVSGYSSLSSMLGDLSMIQKGTYKKSLKAYYALQKTSSQDDESSKTTDSDTTLSLLKSSAKSLNQSAKKLVSTDYGKVTSENLLKDVKQFISDYNETLDVSGKLNTCSMLKTAVWTKNQMNASEGLLNKVGITIGEDNKLAIDEEAFKELFESGRHSEITTLFKGTNSLASRIAQKASTLTNQSTNQMAVNQGRSTYTQYGMWRY